MTNNNQTIEIQKEKYLALLERVFGFKKSEEGLALEAVIASKLKGYGRSAEFEPTPAKLKEVFEDIMLLAEYYALVTTP
jgi:hypothetical protein